MNFVRGIEREVTRGMATKEVRMCDMEDLGNR
jgi:hypothetical protein